MQKQVTSIEQSKWLLELGVPDDRACMVWVPNWTFDERMRQFEPTGDYNVCFRYAAYKVMEEELTLLSRSRICCVCSLRYSTIIMDMGYPST